MPMSSYEVVKRAIEFDSPDRLPVNFDSLGISDIHRVSWDQKGCGEFSEKVSHDE